MIDLHKRARSLGKELSTTTLMDEQRSVVPMHGRCRRQEDVEDLEETIKSLREENQFLLEENALLELNSITSKMSIRPDSWTGSTMVENDMSLLVPIQCQVGESVLQVENRLLKEQITRLQYISRIWDRYTAELHILQKENQMLKDLRQ
jgi:hypothetical protein